jgi:hypothetical protein
MVHLLSPPSALSAGAILLGSGRLLRLLHWLPSGHSSGPCSFCASCPPSVQPLARQQDRSVSCEKSRFLPSSLPIYYNHKGCCYTIPVASALRHPEHSHAHGKTREDVRRESHYALLCRESHTERHRHIHTYTQRAPDLRALGGTLDVVFDGSLKHRNLSHATTAERERQRESQDHMGQQS